MRTYEALYIVSPELDDSAIQTVVTDVEGLISSNSGTIVRSDVWGKRKLAYTIKKHVEGVYIVLRFEANPDYIKRFEQQLRLMDPVIRYMVLYLDEQTLRLEAEQQCQYEEALRASADRHSRDDDDDDDERVPTQRRRDSEAVEAEKSPVSTEKDEESDAAADKGAEESVVADTGEKEADDAE
ncbi:MAG: 30S ribosomal protein S6 [Candidatus Hydrogenedentes bacterium]|nr:30S ribosomal protein S6 [Candidatus Hydrogenedentota bacterium]